MTVKQYKTQNGLPLNKPLTLNQLFSLLVDNVNNLELSGGTSWGDITGTLSDQTDLQAELNALVVSIGTKQPLDATLTALAVVVTAADKLIYATGVDTFAVTELTAFARTILDDATAAAARVTVLPSMAGNASKALTVNVGETDAEWTAVAGGGESLAATLVIGATTGGTDITVSAGDEIIITDATASRIAQIGASKEVDSLDTVTYPSLTELAYVKGVTSAIQTQLGGKLNTDQAAPQTIINGQPIQDTLTASEIVATDGTKKLQSLAVVTYPSLAELAFVKGVTSAIQTQLNAASGGLTVISKNVDYTAIAGDLIYYDTNGADRTVTPPAAPAANQRFGVYLKTQTLTFRVIITGLDTLYIAGDYVEYQYDGAAWLKTVDKIAKHSASMSRAAAQSITINVTTKILYDTSVFDVGSITDPTTNNRINIRKTAKYKIFLTLFWNAAGNVQHDVYVNGAGVRTFRWSNGVLSTTPVAIHYVSLAAGDYVEEYFYQNIGTANTETGATTKPLMSIHEI